MNSATRISVVSRIGYSSAAEHRWNIPIWVAYRITREHFAEGASKFPRLTRFIQDPDLKDSYKITHDHYTGGGYDRGHMAPHASMQGRNAECVRESYFLTNIAPQTVSLNQGIWKNLEDKEREWASKFGVVFVAVGPIFDLDAGPPKQLIPKRRTLTEQIAIPTHFFKILMRGGGRELHALAFVFPNQRAKFANDKDFEPFQVTIDDVEAQADLDLFMNLEDDLEDELEGRRESLWN